MKYFILIVILLLEGVYLWGADYYAYQSGNYTNAAIWRIGSCNGAAAGSIPGATDNVYICPGVTVTVSSNITCSNLTAWGTFSISGNRNITVSNQFTLNSGSLLTADNNNTNFYVNGNFTFYDGAEINGTQPFNLRVAGSMTNISDGGSLQARVGRVDIWITGMSYIEGEYVFTITGAGTKRFNGGLTIQPSGVFDNTVGEDPFINGDIVNNGSWIGCTGGNCDYTLGNIAGRIINISGANPIPVARINVSQATSVVNNYGTLILGRTGLAGDLLRGTGTFNNYGTLYLTKGNSTPVTISVFNSSYAGNTVYYDNNAAQLIRIPNDGSELL